MRISKSQKTKIQRAIENHEHLRKSYFWTPGNRSQRDYDEKRYTFEVSFTNNGTKYEYSSGYSASCRHCYYTGEFRVNGQRKTVTAFKKLINA